ncbi:MAG TPA: formate dehydrogenase subunit gamma [Xanthobacteraceae bacterium]|nr:formate dehydrogenase subunit gamma [Xanthobacteraceae bacterium]
MTLPAPLRFILGAIALVLLVLVATPGGAQQPSPTSPDANAVSEQQLLQQLKRIQGRDTLPDVKSSVLEQPAGRQWETYHEVYSHWIAGIAIFGILLLLTTFYLWRGTLHFKGGRSGRKMLRFTAFERFVHWLTTVAFFVLALTGLNIAFGKKILLPLIGPEAFSAWAEAAKYAHNFTSFPFTIGVVLMFLLWVASNLPTRVDFEWMKHGGGMFGGEEPPALKFNAGEKLIFWIVVIGGGAAATTGYILLFPFYGTGIAGMQAAQITHSVVAFLYIAATFVHIYMGTLGTEGALEGMWSGEVDVNWAKSHHSLWYDEQMARGEATPTDVRSPATPPQAA